MSALRIAYTVGMSKPHSHLFEVTVTVEGWNEPSLELVMPSWTPGSYMIREYARQRGLRRWLISVPVLTPWLSGLWLALVTPASFEVGRHLIEGLKNPTVVRDRSALDVFPIRPMGVKEAVQRALTGGKA